jgi:hypothetical protein
MSEHLSEVCFPQALGTQLGVMYYTLYNVNDKVGKIRCNLPMSSTCIVASAVIRVPRPDSRVHG